MCDDLKVGSVGCGRGRRQVLDVFDEHPVVGPLHLQHLVLDQLEVHLGLFGGDELLDGEVVLLQVGPLLLQVVQLFEMEIKNL